eukprot:1157407-Pelagomonas_calceolata.AAC.3
MHSDARLLLVSLHTCHSALQVCVVSKNDLCTAQCNVLFLFCFKTESAVAHCAPSRCHCRTCGGFDVAHDLGDALEHKGVHLGEHSLDRLQGETHSTVGRCRSAQRAQVAHVTIGKHRLDRLQGETHGTVGRCRSAQCAQAACGTVGRCQPVSCRVGHMANVVGVG